MSRECRRIRIEVGNWNAEDGSEEDVGFTGNGFQVSGEVVKFMLYFAISL